MKKLMATHNKPKLSLQHGKFVSGVDAREVRVMAVAENYAMVRRAGAFPYVAPIRELVFKESAKKQNRKAEPSN